MKTVPRGPELVFKINGLKASHTLMNIKWNPSYLWKAGYISLWTFMWNASVLKLELSLWHSNTCQNITINLLKTKKQMIVWYHRNDMFFSLKCVRFLSTGTCCEWRVETESRVFYFKSLVWGSCDFENEAQIWYGDKMWTVSVLCVILLFPYVPNSPSTLAAPRSSTPISLPPPTPSPNCHQEKIDS